MTSILVAFSLLVHQEPRSTKEIWRELRPLIQDVGYGHEGFWVFKGVDRDGDILLKTSVLVLSKVLKEERFFFPDSSLPAQIAIHDVAAESWTKGSIAGIVTSSVSLKELDAEDIEVEPISSAYRGFTFSENRYAYANDVRSVSVGTINDRKAVTSSILVRSGKVLSRRDHNLDFCAEAKNAEKVKALLAELIRAAKKTETPIG